jgi:hypothetical protein
MAFNQANPMPDRCLSKLTRTCSDKVSNFAQTAVLISEHTCLVMERLETLHREYEENSKLLSNPLDLADFQQLKERRQAILSEARVLAQTLNIIGWQWFSAEI